MAGLKQVSLQEARPAAPVIQPLEAVAQAQAAAALQLPEGPAKRRALDLLFRAAWAVSDALTPPEVPLPPRYYPDPRTPPPFPPAA